MFAPTFQRPSTRFGNVLLRETSAHSDSVFKLLISLRALDFRVYTNAHKIIDHWIPRIKSNSDCASFDPPFLKKAYHTATETTIELKCPANQSLTNPPYGNRSTWFCTTIRNAVLLMLFDTNSLLSVLITSFHSSVSKSILNCSARYHFP